MSKTTVLIVDDSFFMRKVIGDILRHDPTLHIVGDAADGQQALEKIDQLHPDVVTLDIQMPVMDGIETLQAIMQRPKHPAVLIVSSYVTEGADITLQCLSMGAVDFVLKPSASFSLEMHDIKDLLVQKVHMAATAGTAANRKGKPHAPLAWHQPSDGEIVVIGASTGGPAALEYLLPELPADFPVAVIVAQHLPGTFTESFANRLHQKCRLDVVIAKQGMTIQPGTIYIAGGGYTTTISRHANGPTLSVKENSQDIETPPISPLMQSAAEVYGPHTTGIILTGMGKDGADGMEAIKQAGGHTIVQDEDSSVVFGMGREAVDRKAADAVVPLTDIIKTIAKQIAE